MARDWVVAPSGQGADCVSSAPCPLDRAIYLSEPGDRVVFEPGDYGHGFTTFRKGITFESKVRHAAGFSGRNASAMVNIKHSGTVIRGLRFDGKGRAGQKHGMIRFFSCSDVLLEDNLIENGAGGLVSVGGSVPSARISNVTLRRNTLRRSGLNNQYGEAIYVGYHKGKGTQVKGVLIEGNRVSHFSDNGVDIKPPVKNVRIHYNLFEHQVVRGGKMNAGTIVVQGRDVEIRENIVRHVEAGKAVFNLVDRGVKLIGNVVQDTKGTGGLVRSRGTGVGAKTVIKENCSSSNCGQEEEAIEAVIRAMEPKPDPPLPAPGPPFPAPDPPICKCECQCK